VPQHQQFDVFGCRRPDEQDQPAADLAQDQVKKANRHGPISSPTADHGASLQLKGQAYFWHPPGITAVEIPPRSPCANAYAERFVLTARTEVTNRMLIFGERYLRAVLAEYEVHYNGRRPHRSRQLHPLRPDHPPAGLFQKRIKRQPVLGGLINEYEPTA
jgi:transposase InsO family protein